MAARYSRGMFSPFPSRPIPTRTASTAADAAKMLSAAWLWAGMTASAKPRKTLTAKDRRAMPKNRRAKNLPETPCLSRGFVSCAALPGSPPTSVHAAAAKGSSDMNARPIGRGSPSATKYSMHASTKDAMAHDADRAGSALPYTQPSRSTTKAVDDPVATPPTHRSTSLPAWAAPAITRVPAHATKPAPRTKARLHTKRSARRENRAEAAAPPKGSAWTPGTPKARCCPVPGQLPFRQQGAAVTQPYPGVIRTQAKIRQPRPLPAQSA